MYDAGSVGLLCAIALVVGYGLGLSHTRYFIRPALSAAEVERRTRPRVPGKRRDAPAPTNSVDVE